MYHLVLPLHVMPITAARCTSFNIRGANDKENLVKVEGSVGPQVLHQDKRLNQVGHFAYATEVGKCNLASL